jgi:hypothetical protein
MMYTGVEKEVRNLTDSTVEAVIGQKWLQRRRYWRKVLGEFDTVQYSNLFSSGGEAWVQGYGYGWAMLFRTYYCTVFYRGEGERDGLEEESRSSLGMRTNICN